MIAIIIVAATTTLRSCVTSRVITIGMAWNRVAAKTRVERDTQSRHICSKQDSNEGQRPVERQACYPRTKREYVQRHLSSSVILLLVFVYVEKSKSELSTRFGCEYLEFLICSTPQKSHW